MRFGTCLTLQFLYPLLTRGRPARSMARHSTELPPLRMSRYQRYRTDNTRRTLRKLLVHGRKREAGEREGSRHTSHRGLESGGQGRRGEMSFLLVCRPVACWISSYIIPLLTDVLLYKLRALPITKSRRRHRRLSSFRPCYPPALVVHTFLRSVRRVIPAAIQLSDLCNSPAPVRWHRPPTCRLVS